ncbi:MAG: FprA family A-type flavoprotein [Candidatus Methanoliparum thermophilum]|uniref:FprA family A-type flavoprotein n=1 Tax=Methanoliparum thermophilum TaxID=2491083 RepID=A0A520KSJ8_METT2|nr:FprA family A-type flavoprotein [Candidatus Methanoliparum sp. LAM-1]RZN64898.1 MAG: FprA family A-type flavoprotein [Candidatus Methanoliparum thermophilum]BDC36227.1 MBL fold hydrolase [Candidatus Methanoliparum sp. LAM-1]
MALAREIIKDVYSVGAIDWNRRLFDALILLPDGTSYNSYLVKGSEKVALIDTVDSTMSEVLIENIKEVNIDQIDYIIVNHAEQDHSGTLPRILELFPDAKVLTNPKCKDLLINLLFIPDDKIEVVEDGEEVSLGNKTLKFIYAPWVHWPDTMFTYIVEDKILFTCDFLGSHLATSDLFIEDNIRIYEPAKRYYAEIMMPFRVPHVQRNLKKIRDLDVNIIAASHGPIYNDPSFILDLYDDWASNNVENEVIIPYISMHGSTEEMVRYLTDELIKRGIFVKVFDLTKTDLGDLAMAAVDAATIVVGAPMMLANPHPNVIGPIVLLNALRPKTRFVSLIGSYGWGGRLVESVKELLSNMNVEFIEPVVAKGYPKEEDFRRLDKLADDILKKHKEALKRH